MDFTQENKVSDEKSLSIHYDPTVKVTFASKIVEKIVRLFPDKRGAWFFSKILLSCFPRSFRRVIVEFSREGQSLIELSLDVSDPPQFTMVRKHRYDLGTIFTIWHLLKQSDVVFDVGANSGYITTTASLKVGADGFVVSIEPNREAFNALIDRGLGNIFPLNCVGSDHSGKSFKLKKKFYKQTTSGFFVETKSGGIKSISLDTVYTKMNKPSVRLVKIDAEGAELNIVMGAKQLLTEKTPYLIIEVEKAHLIRYGYSVKDFANFMGKLGYWNYYFIDDANSSIKKMDSLDDGQVLFSKEVLPLDTFQI